MLDGLISHRQVLVDGPNPVAEVHLVLGAAGVALFGRKEDSQQIQIERNERQEELTRKQLSSYLFLVDNECDVITRGHGQHLSFDADL